MKSSLGALVLILAPAPAFAEFALTDLLGSWTGEGLYSEGLSKARMKCKLSGVAQDKGVRITGRCASSLGSHAVDMQIKPTEDGSIQLTSGPKASRVDSDIDLVSGAINGTQLFLTGSAAQETVKMQFAKNADGTLHFATERVWRTGKSQSKITLTQR